MYVTCKCLNVWIKTQGNEFKNLNEDDVELSKLERADSFFKEEVFNYYFNQSIIYHVINI